MAFELIKKWCSIGTKTALPQSQDGSIPNRASFDEGFPTVCSEDKNAGGLPPRREDINEILYLTSSNLAEFQSGNYPTFDADVATYLSGYPIDSILWCASLKTFVRSVNASNTDNFVTNPEYIGDSWVTLFNNIEKIPFCVNSGHTVSGFSRLASFTSNTVTFLVGGSYANLTYTTASGITKIVSSISDLDFSSGTSGVTYTVTINGSTGVVSYRANVVYRQISEPTVKVTGDIWYNTSVSPKVAYEWSGTAWVVTDEVPLITVYRGVTEIFSIYSLPFNYNGDGMKLFESSGNDADPGWYESYYKFNKVGNEIFMWIVQGGQFASDSTGVINIPLNISMGSTYNVSVTQTKTGNTTRNIPVVYRQPTYFSVDIEAGEIGSIYPIMWVVQGKSSTTFTKINTNL